VSPEREHADQVVAELNESLKLAGLQIDLLKWEQRPPGYGRPQEQINAMIDECDLFVGLLWQRWGSPTGKFSSGFEEEFQHAITRRGKNGVAPEIWLVFKHVSPTFLKDPGAQLQKVLSFKAEQQDLNQVLFKKVKSTPDWVKSLRTWLNQFCLPIALHNAPQSEKPQANLLPPQISTSENVFQDPEFSVQLTNLIPKIGSAIIAGSEEFDRTSSNRLSEFEVVRLFLLVSTWMSRRYTNEPIGIREMNLLHSYRYEMEPTNKETYELLRSLIVDTSDVIPGWFWARQMNEAEATTWLLNLARRDPSEFVRQRALDLMKTAQLWIPESWWADLPFKDSEWTVRNAAYNYLAEVGDKTALSLMDQPEADSTLSSAEYAKMHLLLRVSPTEAVADLLKEGGAFYFPDDIERSIVEAMPGSATDVLTKALEASGPKIRSAASSLLLERNALPLVKAKELLTDPDLSVRMNGLLSLVKSGDTPSLHEIKRLLKQDDGNSAKSLLGGGLEIDPLQLGKADTVIIAYFRTKTFEELKALLDWFDLDGRLAYHALALQYFDRFVDEIRLDLETSFIRIKEESEQRIETAMRDKMIAAFKPYESFIRAEYAEAAFHGILQAGDASFVELARKYVSVENTKVKTLATKVLLNFGGSQDAPTMLELAMEKWGPWREPAAHAALKFSSDPKATALALFDTNSSEVSKVAFEWLMTCDALEIQEVFQMQLHDNKEGKRVRAVFYLQQHAKSKEELEKVLRDYQERESYYYNVVTWLDRLLYAPDLLREDFRRRLRKEALSASL
jgi:hypothetical protein